MTIERRSLACSSKASRPPFRPARARTIARPPTNSFEWRALEQRRREQRRKADGQHPAPHHLAGRDARQRAVDRALLHDSPGRHPFDAVEWELRDARIGHGDRVAFEQRDVEFPKSWSQNATNIVAQKYFRGQLGSPARERSVKQMIGRVAGTIAGWGRERGYFATDEDADAFEAELTHILLHQMAAFNSPVWFNVGFEEQPAVLGLLHPLASRTRWSRSSTGTPRRA